MNETQENAGAAPLPPQVKQPLQVALVSLAQAATAMPSDHAGLPVVVGSMMELAKVMGLDFEDGEGVEAS